MIYALVEKKLKSFAETYRPRQQTIQSRPLTKHHDVSFQENLQPKEVMSQTFSQGNKADVREFIQYTTTLHPNYNNIDTVEKAKTKVLRMFNQKEKIDQKEFNIMDQLTDTKKLGRYYNFLGASSKVATYIKSLSKAVQTKFVNIEDYLQHLETEKHLKDRQVEKLQSTVRNTYNEIDRINKDEIFLIQNDIFGKRQESTSNLDLLQDMIENNHQKNYLNQYSKTQEDIKHLKLKIKDQINKSILLRQYYNLPYIQENLDSNCEIIKKYFQYNNQMDQYTMQRIHSRMTDKFQKKFRQPKKRTKSVECEFLKKENKGPLVIPLQASPRLYQ